MALGLNTSSAGGDFIPHVRYDARAGRLFRADRAQDSDGWKTTMVDISQTSRGRGRITVHFTSIEEFDGLRRLLADPVPASAQHRKVA